MELVDHRREHVRRLRMEVVARPVQVGRHQRYPADAELRARRFNQLNSCDLRDCVRLIRGLQRSREQIILAKWLRSFPRINARAAEEYEPLDAMLERGRDDVVLDR